MAAIAKGPTYYKVFCQWMTFFFIFIKLSFELRSLSVCPIQDQEIVLKNAGEKVYHDFDND